MKNTILVRINIYNDNYGDGNLNANLGQYNVCSATISLYKWAYPMPIHFYLNAMLIESNILSLEKDE